MKQATSSLFALVDVNTPLPTIIGPGLAQGFFSSLHFSNMNSMAYAPTSPRPIPAWPAPFPVRCSSCP